MTRFGLAATLVWGLLVVIAAVLAVRATYTTDLSAFLPRTPTASQRLLVEQLREGLAARLVMMGIEGTEPAVRARLATELARRLRADPQFVLVEDGDGFDAAATQAFVFGHRYLLSEAVTPQRFTPAGLHEAIGDTLDLLASPEGLLLKPLFVRDPTAETVNVVESFGPQRIRTQDGVWSSRDGRRTLLLAQTRAAGSDTDGQERACTAIKSAFAAAARVIPGTTGAVLRMSGSGVLAVAARATIKSQVIRLSLLSAALIAALLLVVYRSVAALLLGFVPVASGALAGVAAVATGFGAVHGITLGFGVTLIGEAVDYSIYLFIQGDAHGAWRRTVWPTIRLGMLTSICGFAALVPSGFQGLGQLGLYSIAGLTAAALVTRFVLPAWRPAGVRVRDLSGLGRMLERGLRGARRARVLLILVPLFALAALYLHRGALWSLELSSLSPVTAADQALNGQLREDLGAPDARYVVAVSAPDRESALVAAQAVAQRLTGLVAAGVIGGFDSPSRYLPSLATQRGRQASLPQPAELTARLREALAGLPVSAARLAPFVEDVDAARRAAPITRADLTGTALAAGLDALLTEGHGRSLAFLPLTPAAGGELAPPAIARVRSALAGAAPAQVLLLDLKGEADELYTGYLHQAVSLSLAGFAAIVLLLLLSGLTPLRVTRVVAPLVLAVLGVAGALIALGAQLTILHVVGMLLTVAVGSNYALFFDRSAHGEATSVPRTLASLLIANLCTVMGFGVLACSSVPVLAALGRTVAPGALLALVFSALLAHSLAPHGARAAPPAAP